MPKEQEERLNPKAVLRRIMELMPDGTELHVRDTLMALYAHSNGLLKAEDLDAGTVKFAGSVSNSQLGAVCGIKTIRGIQRRMEELRGLGLVKTQINANRQHGSLFEVTYSTPPRSVRRDPKSNQYTQEDVDAGYVKNGNVCNCGAAGCGGKKGGCPCWCHDEKDPDQIECGRLLVDPIEDRDECFHCHAGFFSPKTSCCSNCGKHLFEIIED